MEKARVIPHTSWAAKSLWSVEGKTMSMLLFALAILGIGDGLIVLANFGSSPWTVLSQGVALQAKVSIGWSSFWISCLVMLAWIPLKLRFGLGTILNIIVIALASPQKLCQNQPHFLAEFYSVELGFCFMD